MLNNDFWSRVGEDQDKYNQNRRQIIGQANQALHLSKQVIFALHRNNLDDSQAKLDEAKKILQEIEKQFGVDNALRSEGAWSAAVEEFVEAHLFFDYIKGETVGEISGLTVRPAEYLGGLSDYSGELVRRAVLFGAKQDKESIATIAEEINQVVEQLLAYNLTGVLRTKFDQAKRNLQKVEHIVYELNV